MTTSTNIVTIYLQIGFFYIFLFISRTVMEFTSSRDILVSRKVFFSTLSTNGLYPFLNKMLKLF